MFLFKSDIRFNYVNLGGCSWLSSPKILWSQNVGDSKNTEPREAFDRDAPIQADETRNESAQRSTTTSQAGGTKTPAPRQHSRQGDS